MNYSKDEVLQYCLEEDVKFVRLAFCDVFGKLKNISIMPEELPRAFNYGIGFDASAVHGFGDEAHSDLVLHPEPDTLTPLPWRPEHGRVVRMFCNITYPDGTPFECDSRNILREAVSFAKTNGYAFNFGAEQEFYLFKLDENGEKTNTTYDNAGYMDIAPADKGENIRREICLTLEQMGIRTESSHHEEGPGQNEIDFRYSDPLTAADNVMTFQTVVKTISNRNGLFADFSPKPLPDMPGNGFHANFSIVDDSGEDLNYAIAGILQKIPDMTVFCNPTAESYKRLGQNKAPSCISWSYQNRSQLIRIPAAIGEFKRAELRSPDPSANPYITFALIIYASIAGLKEKTQLPESVDINLFTADKETLKSIKRLPQNIESAKQIAKASKFINEYMPARVLDIYCKD